MKKLSAMLFISFANIGLCGQASDEEAFINDVSAIYTAIEEVKAEMDVCASLFPEFSIENAAAYETWAGNNKQVNDKIEDILKKSSKNSKIYIKSRDSAKKQREFTERRFKDYQISSITGLAIASCKQYASDLSDWTGQFRPFLASDFSRELQSINFYLDPKAKALYEKQIAKEAQREATEKNRCATIGGDWIRVCMSQRYFCVTKFSDGGKSCEKSTECEGGCLSNGSPNSAKGFCRKDNYPCGCFEYFESNGRGGICID